MPHWRRSFARPLLTSHDDEEQLSLDVDGIAAAEVFLLRWHVDEDDEDLARVHAGSGSHNLDAPYLARQRCRGWLIHQHLWGQGPFQFGGGRRPHKERIEAVHASNFTQLRAARMRKTLLLLVCVY